MYNAYLQAYEFPFRGIVVPTPDRAAKPPEIPILKQISLI